MRMKEGERWRGQGDACRDHKETEERQRRGPIFFFSFSRKTLKTLKKRGRGI